MSSICPIICHTFIPILTPSYIERLGYGGYAAQNATDWSFVLEEWQCGMQLVNGGAMNYLPVIRAGECERSEALLLGAGPDMAFDMTEPAHHYDEHVQIIAQMMLHVWDGDHPLIRCDLPEFVDLYIGWCRGTGGARATTPVEDWKVDALHTGLSFGELVSRR